MIFRKPLLTLILAYLAISGVSAVPLMAQDTPYSGLWFSAPRGEAGDGLFLYQAALRYRAKATLRSAGMLPEQFRAVEDSLGLLSNRFEDFIIIQDSLGMGWLPPSTLPVGNQRSVTRQVSVEIESGLVEESVVYGGTPVHPTVPIEIEDYLDKKIHETYRTHWVREAGRSVQMTDTKGRDKTGVLPELTLPLEMPGAIKSIVGSGKPNLQVNGSERISFSGTSSWYPDRPVTEFQREQSKFPQLDMKQELNLKLTGNIGDKVSVDVDQSSQASTPLANRIRIHYAGYEDEIVQRVELGNTSLSLPGTQYVSYSGKHEGLFGINAQGLIGDLEIAAILSKQEGKNDTRSITRGAEIQNREIEDWRYRGGKFFFLVDPDGPPLNDLEEGSVEVWIDDRNGTNNHLQLTIPGIVTMSGDPALPEPVEERETGMFNRLVPNEDFIVQDNVYEGYPVLILSDRQILDGRMTKAMAVSYRTVSGEVVGGVTGTDSETLILKLIRPANEMGGTNPVNLTQGVFAETRHLELRNIYDLGSNLSQEGLEVRIRKKGTIGGATDPDRIGDATFLSITGLDLKTSVAGGEESPGPDTKVDEGRIQLETGYLMFRELHPFAPTPEDIERRFLEARPDTIDGDLAVPEIYLRNNWSSGQDPDLVSGYKFVVTARSISSRITLGFNLLQGSETVTSGGRTLIRDRDYSIDYDTGEIQILDTADVSDTDEIRVSYSYLPFGGGGQKTLIGSGLRYRPPESRFGLSTTWVYESKGAPGIEGRRPRLGQEPTRTVVGEFATSLKSDSWMLTSLVDALPGVSTRQKSNFSIDAGLGMSFPNPNTRGQLYVDDFEGAKDEFTVSMNRLSWRPSGIPLRADGSIGPSVTTRGECWWYSPRSAVKEGDLQPTLFDVGGLADTEKDNNRSVLELHFFPNGITEELKKDSWFSLVQPLSTRGTDLSRAQFLDFWVNDFIPIDRLHEREGTIHLEIGVVSEDAIWQRVPPDQLNESSFQAPDGMLNSEDDNEDGQLDDPGGGQGEDIGYDFLTDAEEGTGADPAFDNWEFSESSEDNDRKEPADDPTRTQRYQHINGTQGNGRLDTEDLNGNVILEGLNSYFHFAFDLADTSLVEAESSLAPDQDSEYSNFTRGWRRIRIPLASMDTVGVGVPSWDQVRHVRLWLEGFSKETYLQIGGIDITGNRWLKAAIRDTLGNEIPASELAEGEDFFPAVLNNKDNSTAEYMPPFQPRERQNVEEREQSLTLEMRSFPAGHVGSVFRTFTQDQDFSNLYRTLEFYLNMRIREGPTPNLECFVRFSRDAATDTTNYYEYRVPVSENWDLKSVDLGELSRLQLAEACSAGVCLVVEKLEDGAQIARKGNPNLTAIRRITFGVINRGPTAVVSGNIWVDELRLTGVKRDTGTAGRVAFGMTLADLGNVNINFDRTDANFLRIGSDKGEGKTRTNVSANTRLNLDKFMTGTGLTLPVTYSMSRSRDVPKFRPGSDLVLEEATDRDISEFATQDFTFSVSRRRSENRFLRYTLDGISLSGQMGENRTDNPLSKTTTTRRSGTVQYTLPLGGGPSLRVYRNTELRLLPTNFAMNVSGGLTKTSKFERSGGDLNSEFVRTPIGTTRQGAMSWSTGMRPIDPITYTFNQSRNLRLGTASKKLLGVNLGTETRRSHKLTASHQVTILPKSLNLSPKASWSSTFDGNFNTIMSGTSTGSARMNGFNNSSTMSFSGALPVHRFLRLFGSLRPKGKPETEAPADSAGTDQAPRRPQRGAGTRSRAAGGKGFFSLGAVSATYTIGKTNRLDNVRGEPSIGYQLGWSREAGPDVVRSSAAAAASGDRRDLNISTDMTILSEVKIRTSFVRGYNKNSVNGASTINRTQRFPDLSVNWGRLHQKLGLDRIARDLRASSNYSRNRTKQTSGGTVGTRRDETKVAMNPFLNLDAKIGKDTSTKLTSSYETLDSETMTGTVKSSAKNRRRQVGLTLSRTLNLSRMVTNPITKKKSRVTSKLDLSLSAKYSDDRQETTQGTRSVVARDLMRVDISTTAGYNFTSSITGSAAISFGQNTDRKTRSNTVRTVGVTVSASFRF